MFRHHRAWYRASWWGRRWIRRAVFLSWATRPTTVYVSGTTYYYLDNALYVADAEGGYLNAEPPMDGITQEVPEGATVVQEDGKMYFQFDTVFFEQVTSNSGTSYKVVPPPGVSDVAT